MNSLPQSSQQDACEQGLILFTKPATVKQVKTRLAAALTLNERQTLHAAMRSDVLSETASAQWRTLIGWDPGGGGDPDLKLPSLTQSGEDLGKRLENALCAGQRHWQRVAIVGSDHPELERRQIGLAFDQLKNGADLVLGPATDGGFYLIATRRETIVDGLLEGVRWSEESVLSTVVASAQHRRLDTRLIEKLSDVDTPGDLQRLVFRLKDDLQRCPATRAALEAMGRLVPRGAARSQTMA